MFLPTLPSFLPSLPFLPVCFPFLMSAYYVPYYMTVILVAEVTELNKGIDIEPWCIQLPGQEVITLAQCSGDQGGPEETVGLKMGEE